MAKIIDGTPVDAATTNPAFLGRRDDDYTIGKLGLQNADSVSGTAITNTQQELNSTSSFVGKAVNLSATLLPTYTSNEGFGVNDPLRTRLDTVSGKFSLTTGHAHSGVLGDGTPIQSSYIQSVPLSGSMVQGTNLTGVTGSSTDVSSLLAGYTASTGSGVYGVVVNFPYNKIILRDLNGDKIVNGTGDEIYGRLGYSSPTWTLSYWYLNGATETSYNFGVSTDMQWWFQHLYNPIVDKPVYSDTLFTPSDNATADVVDATATQRGVVNTGTQTFGGNKTFTGTIGAANLSGTNTGDVSLTNVGAVPSADGASLSGQALTLQPADGTHPGVVTAGTQTIGGNKTFTGTIGASNLSGTNTGDVTLTAVGGTPNGNAASLSGQALTMQPADATNPGVVTSGSQTFGGAKTFNGDLIAAATLQAQMYLDSVTTGTDATISTVNQSTIKLTNGTLVSVAMINRTSDGMILNLVNGTGAALTIKNETGATPSQRITTGTGVDLSVSNNGVIQLIYDTDAARWKCLGTSTVGAVTLKVTSLFNPSTFTVTNDDVVIIRSQTGGCTINLPNPAIFTKQLVIRKANENNFGVQIFPLGGGNIDGVGEYFLVEKQQSVTLVSDASNWYIL